MIIIKIILAAIAAIAGFFFFWLFVLKLVMKIAKSEKKAPCPASLSWIVNLPIRRRYMRHVIDRVAPREGETVLELGPGPGAFSIDMARRLGPEGKLFSVDIQPKMIELLNDKIRKAKVNNIQTIVASAYDMPLDDNSIDRVFLVTVLPEIPDPAKGLREIYRVLKPGGLFSTTEEFLDPDYPMKKTTKKWAMEAGFIPDRDFGNWLVYTVNFRKPGQETVS